MANKQLAKREGICKDCEEPIKIGEAIHYIVAWGIVHDSCPKWSR